MLGYKNNSLTANAGGSDTLPPKPSINTNEELRVFYHTQGYSLSEADLDLQTLVCKTKSHNLSVMVEIFSLETYNKNQK